jgi:hypothetical protein
MKQRDRKEGEKGFNPVLPPPLTVLGLEFRTSPLDSLP